MPSEPAPVPNAAGDPSYRALLAVPTLGRVLVGMLIARIATSMLGVAVVLFSLAEYDSPGIAGLVTFVSIFPGLLLSPVAGALLDRHGRTRLIVLDFLVAMAAMTLIGILALAGLLELPLLLLIAGLASLTGPLSNSGLRSLFPIIVPRPLWERVNAVDANGWVLAAIVGPPAGALAVGLVGGAWAVIVVGATFGIAAWVMSGVPEPSGTQQGDGSGRLLGDAWRGLRYAWSNRTIRALGVGLSCLNVGAGMVTIVVPLIVLRRLELDEPVVGAAFAVQGIAGVAAGFVAGRIDTRGRERVLIAGPMLLTAPATALLFAADGLPVLLVAMALFGLLTAPMDVALFTTRQRRTDPAWMGRAFAISMAINYSGTPIGAAVGGTLAASSIDAAVAVGVVASLAAGLSVLALLPARAKEYDAPAGSQGAASPPPPTLPERSPPG